MNVSSRALKRPSKKDNLGNGGKLTTKQNRVYEGRQLVGKRHLLLSFAWRL